MKIQTQLTSKALTEAEPLLIAGGLGILLGKALATAAAIIKVARSGEWRQGTIDGITVKYDKKSNGVFRLSDWGMADYLLKKKYVKLVSGDSVFDHMHTLASWGFIKTPVLLFLTAKGKAALTDEKSWFTYPW
jgi:hypothetical protein